jgi:NAD(P)H-hydrate epimerase
MENLDFKALLAVLPQRMPNSHKGNFGHVLVIGGDIGYPGAPVLAALGALRVGAGLVTLASHSNHLIGINAVHPEIICHAIDSATDLAPALERATVIVLGPGLGRTTWSQKIFQRVLQSELPMVLDADALFFLALKAINNANIVLTPHPGEAARLLHTKEAIQEDQRVAAIKQLIDKYHATVVLKGSGTLVGSYNTAIGICTAGNPGMASGGMGDLLSGVIGGLIAQGLDLDTAAKLGVCVHAKAGDLAANTGQRGTIATDLLMPIKLLME